MQEQVLGRQMVLQETPNGRVTSKDRWLEMRDLRFGVWQVWDWEVSQIWCSWEICTNTMSFGALTRTPRGKNGAWAKGLLGRTARTTHTKPGSR